MQRVSGKMFYLSACAVVVGMLVLSACSQHGAHQSGIAPMQQADGRTAKQESARKLIRQAEQELEVDDVASAVGAATRLVEDQGGYVENSAVRNEGRADLVLRVPAKELETTMDMLAALGDESRRFIRVDDVTEQYIDLEARLKNTIALRDRLRVLLDKANTVSEVLSVEKELTRIQSELDSLEGRLKSLRNRVALARLELELHEEQILGPLGYLGYGVGWVIGKLFVIQ